MSESKINPEQQNKSARGGGKQPRTSSNPLQGSALLSTDVPELPALPAASSPAPGQSPAAASTESQPGKMLYNTPPPAEYQLRPFEQRHDRQTVYFDARKAGAWEALVKLVKRGNKTDLLEEMVDDLLAKYAQTLAENEDLVRLLEDRFRKKHNL